MQRYIDLIKLVEKLKPEKIIEIGTWNGDRAIEMCQWGAQYIGFDLFDQATSVTDAREFNVKPHVSRDDVCDKLDRAGVKHALITGDTRDTLPVFGQHVEADFAFIDGGHSVGTIASDWANLQRYLKEGATVVFDDYYIPEKKGFGCNSIVRHIGDWELFGSADPVIGGGQVMLARVTI